MPEAQVEHEYAEVHAASPRDSAPQIPEGTIEAEIRGQVPERAVEPAKARTLQQDGPPGEYEDRLQSEEPSIQLHIG